MLAESEQEGMEWKKLNEYNFQQKKKNANFRYSNSSVYLQERKSVLKGRRERS